MTEPCSAIFYPQGFTPLFRQCPPPRPPPTRIDPKRHTSHPASSMSIARRGNGVECSKMQASWIHQRFSGRQCDEPAAPFAVRLLHVLLLHRVQEFQLFTVLKRRGTFLVHKPLMLEGGVGPSGIKLSFEVIHVTETEGGLAANQCPLFFAGKNCIKIFVLTSRFSTLGKGKRWRSSTFSSSN